MRSQPHAATLVAASLIMSASGGTLALGDTFASPAGYENVGGDSAQNTILRDASRTYQMIFDPSALPGLSIGDQITGFRWRASALPGAGAPASWPLPGQTSSFSNFRIWLAPAALDASSMSNTIAANIGAGEQLVRSGPLSVPAGSFINTGGAGPNPWGVFFGFDTPYTYTGGPLVMTIRHPGATGSEALFLDAVDGGSASLGVRALAALTDIHEVAPFAHSTITQFTVVPAPGGGVIIAAGGMALGVRRRGRR